MDFCWKFHRTLDSKSSKIILGQYWMFKVIRQFKYKMLKHTKRS